MSSGPGEETAQFRESLRNVTPLRLHEPLAAALGALVDGDIVEFELTDVVKAAGHACPSVTGAYLAVREALARLYGDETPVRGGIGVVVYGEPDEGAYGVMSQVMGMITGAAPDTGFKGLGPLYRRQGLLEFSREKPDPEAACFLFFRLDTGRSALVRFQPWNIPFSPEKAARLAQLMEKVLAGTAEVAERHEFGELWQAKVTGMLAGDRMEDWLTVEEA